MTNRKEKGFTLIELTLALAFISFLLLFLVLSILQITRLYVKGSAIRQINQTGRQLLDDVGTALRSNTTPLYVVNNNRLCAGTTSYAWNVYNNADGHVKNTFSGSDASTELRFISVQDPGADLCKSTGPIDKVGTMDLVGPEITPLAFSVEQQGKLWDISLVLSTSGDNVAHPDASTPTLFSCDPKIQFCAFGDFETSIYSREGD